METRDQEIEELVKMIDGKMNGGVSRIFYHSHSKADGIGRRAEESNRGSMKEKVRC